jgi:hypothetical protein
MPAFGDGLSSSQYNDVDRLVTTSTRNTRLPGNGVHAQYAHSHTGSHRYCHLKTTLDIADPLLREARKIALREGTTVRALVEQGLRRVIEERARKPAFRLRKASVTGHRVRPELADAGWDRLCDLIYDRRGE